MMKIQARFMGVIEGSLVHKEGTAEFPSGITLKDFFKKADRALGLSPTPCFKIALKQKIHPSVMINGNPIILPDDLGHQLRDGDEISVLLPMAGG
jgi:molybdopterin converting factor small subunit